MEQEPSQEVIKEATFAEIDKILENLPDQKEIEDYFEDVTAELDKYFKGELTKDIPLPKGAIEIADFELLKEILLKKFNFSDKVVDEIVEHEKDHFAEAEKNEFSPKIYLSFSQTSDDRLAIKPFIYYKSENADIINFKEKRKKIAKAPKKLSEKDVETLKKIA
ncbi:MAG: hypothetical protein WC663_00570 [Patescibacteria group bacterium]|jgi:hypothetical protein